MTGLVPTPAPARRHHPRRRSRGRRSCCRTCVDSLPDMKHSRSGQDFANEASLRAIWAARSFACISHGARGRTRPVSSKDLRLAHTAATFSAVCSTSTTRSPRRRRRWWPPARGGSCRPFRRRQRSTATRFALGQALALVKTSPTRATLTAGLRPCQIRRDLLFARA
jgi:hypothetical protein